MCSSQAMMMLIEVHHLETIELVRHSLDLLCFSRLDRLDAMSIPESL